jgi:hypothetical protein
MVFGGIGQLAGAALYEGVRRFWCSRLALRARLDGFLSALWKPGNDFFGGRAIGAEWPVTAVIAAESFSVTWSS